MRTRVVVCLVLTVGVAVGWVRPAEAVEAVSPSNRPTPLRDVENGRVPSDRLIAVVPGCSVAREAAPSLYRVFALARASNVALGARDCYRPLADQVSVGAAWTARGNSACAAQPARSPDGKVVGTSMHGWGKAVDFSNAGGPMTFRSSGYRFLKQRAAAVGWNHPGWAEPGGSRCPEPWHWEWVGDGGTIGAAPVRADVVAVLPGRAADGYALVDGLGGVAHRGSSVDRGSAASVPLAWVVIGGVRVPAGDGYWLGAADGGVFTFGDAAFLGSLGGARLNAPVVAMAATPTGRGYWLVAADGGVFTFGDAAFLGSLGGTRLNAPVVAMAATPTGRGYWLVAGDGGVFTFGDAAFSGSTGGMRLNAPIVGIASSASGAGYSLLGADGGLFTFGDWAFLGSGGGSGIPSPFVSIAPTPTGRGYRLAAADGTVLPFGDATG